MNPKELDIKRFTNDEIARYYDETRWHYRGLWTGKDSLALHYAYWDETVDSHIEGLHRLNAVLAAKADIGTKDYVLDAGSGWGGSAIWLAQETGARVHGVTISADQVDKAKEKAEAQGVNERVAFSLQDFHSLDFDDRTFDVVWTVESVCHSPAKDLVAREFHRVLKPGGRLVMSDFFRADRPLTVRRELALTEWVRQWAVPDLETFDEIRDKLQEAGFRNVEVQDATKNVTPAAKRLYRLGLATAAPAIAFRLLRIHSPQQQANWRSSLLQYRALKLGAWRYGIISATRS